MDNYVVLVTLIRGDTDIENGAVAGNKAFGA